MAELPRELLFPAFLCVSEKQILFFGNVLCLVGQYFYMYVCMYICSRVYIWSGCKGCIYALMLLNICHFTVPPCLLTLLPWEATEARSPLYVQVKCPPTRPYGLQSHYWPHLQRMVIK